MSLELIDWLVKSIQDKPPEWISAIASVVSVLGVFLVGRQLVFTKKIAQLVFEDNLEKEYRDLAAQIPTKDLLDSDLNDDKYRQAFDDFFRYFDLSNTQVVLRKQSRIGDSTWKSWCVGIRFNLSSPAFARAWSEVKLQTSDETDDFFSELGRLESDKFVPDPQRWK